MVNEVEGRVKACWLSQTYRWVIIINSKSHSNATLNWIPGSVQSKLTPSRLEAKVPLGLAAWGKRAGLRCP